MGFIKTILSLALLVVIAVFAYWLYAAYALEPNAPYWAQINRSMPDPLRRFACQELRTRAGTVSVDSCEGY